MDQHDRRHAVDIELGCTAVSGAGEPTRCCAVCTEPLAWVTTVGSCGQGVVCPGCMVRVRFVEGDRCCGVCGAECPPAVIVAKAADSARGGAPAVPALSPQPASKEVKVGEGWYHGDTAAHFHDVQQDEEARDAKARRRDDLLDTLIPGFFFAVLIGATVWAMVVMYPSGKI